MQVVLIELAALKRIGTDVHVKGPTIDTSRLGPEIKLVEGLGGKHVVLNIETGGLSTTDLVERIRGASS